MSSGLIYPAYKMGSGKSEAIGDKGFFKASVDGDDLNVEITANRSSVVTIHFEFEPGFPDPGIMFGAGKFLSHDELADAPKGELIFVPSAASHEGVVGERAVEELAKYSHTLTLDGDTAVHVLKRVIPKERWNGSGAIKINISIDGERWKASDSPVYTLGKGEQSADEYGFLIP